MKVRYKISNFHYLIRPFKVYTSILVPRDLLQLSSKPKKYKIHFTNKLLKKF